MPKLNNSGTRALTIVSVFSLVPSVAAARSPNDAVLIEEIVLVGTRLSDRNVEQSLAPVDILSSGDLFTGGILDGETAEWLKALVPSFNLQRQSNSDFADLVRPAQLRGLSPDQTLVLVNGKRRHITASITSESKLGRGTSPVDLNTIPTSAIKTIEVLRDGASAQYGSDAIAGVINIVLKDSATDGSVSTTYGQHRTKFDLTDKYINDGETFLVTANKGFTIGTDGFVNLSMDYRDRKGTNRSGFDEIPFFEEQTPDNLALRGWRTFQVGDPDVEDLNLAFNSSFNVANNTEFYSFGTYSHREGEGANFFRYPDDDDNVKEIYPNGFRPLLDGTIDDHSLAFGLRGKTASDWTWDLSTAYGRNIFDWDITNSLNASFGAGDDNPTSFNVAEFQYSQWTLNLDVAKYMDLGLPQPVHVALGAEYRDEAYETEAGDEASYIAGPDTSKTIGAQGGPGLSPEGTVDVDRDAYSLYADLETRLTDSFSVGVATRYEDYSDFGNTFNGKLSGRLALTPAMALRGTVSSGFRAPSLSQAFFRGASTSFGPDGNLQVTQNLPVNDPVAQALGARELDPEESFNLSLGFVANFDSGLGFSIDFYKVDIDDRITLSEEIGGGDPDASDPRPTVTEYLASLGFPNITSVRFFTNAVDTETKGVDIVLDYEFDLGGGLLATTLAYNHSETEVISIDANPPELDNVQGVGAIVFGDEELNTLESASPQNKFILMTNWSYLDWAIMGRVTRYGSVKRVFSFDPAAQQRFDAEWVADLNVEYSLTRNLSMAFGGNNIFDNYPDQSQPIMNYFGNLPYDVISPIGVNGAYYYVSASYNF